MILPTLKYSAETVSVSAQRFSRYVLDPTQRNQLH